MKCIWCDTEISESAHFCIHCDHWQDRAFERWKTLGASLTALSILASATLFVGNFAWKAITARLLPSIEVVSWATERDGVIINIGSAPVFVRHFEIEIPELDLRAVHGINEWIEPAGSSVIDLRSRAVVRSEESESANFLNRIGLPLSSSDFSLALRQRPDVRPMIYSQNDYELLSALDQQPEDLSEQHIHVCRIAVETRHRQSVLNFPCVVIVGFFGDGADIERIILETQESLEQENEI